MLYQPGVQALAVAGDDDVHGEWRELAYAGRPLFQVGFGGVAGLVAGQDHAAAKQQFARGEVNRDFIGRLGGAGIDHLDLLGSEGQLEAVLDGKDMIGWEIGRAHV